MYSDCVRYSARLVNLPFVVLICTRFLHRQQVGARLHTIEELHDALQRLWDDLGLNPHEDACLAEFAKAPTSEDEDVVLSLERIAEYERLIAEAQAAKVLIRLVLLASGTCLIPLKLAARENGQDSRDGA